VDRRRPRSVFIFPLLDSGRPTRAQRVTLGKRTFEVAAAVGAAISLALSRELFSGEYQVGAPRFRLIDIAWRSQRG
jgi:hypothetical protein